VTERAVIEVVLPADVIERIVEDVVERVLAELRRDQGRRWLPVREAAVELGLSEGALRKSIARGHVKVRPGRDDDPRRHERDRG
jgi:hypothetical protein